MENSDEQNTYSQLDPYLESPKTFHLEMPSYHDFDLSIGVIEERIYELLSNRNTIDAYCIWCDKEGVFRAYDYLSDNVSIPRWTTRNNGLIEIEYRCTRNESHAYHSYYFKAGNFFTKVGQFPRLLIFKFRKPRNTEKSSAKKSIKNLQEVLASPLTVWVLVHLFISVEFLKILLKKHKQKHKLKIKNFRTMSTLKREWTIK